MFTWRITKYDPKNRDSRGVYLLNEWTAYSDIDKVIAGKSLNYTQYLAVENAYVNVINLFMVCNQLRELSVSTLEKKLDLINDPNLNPLMVNLFKRIKRGLRLSREEIDAVSRLVLRDELWCIIESVDIMRVRFDWDYYMYIGSANKCDDVIYKIQQSGLFVEACDPEYLE